MTQFNRHVFNKLTLAGGNHTDPGQGVCAMEAVAYVAGEKHSDKPECCDPIIGAFMRAWNDGLPTNADRDKWLKPLIPKLIGTKASKETETQRSWMACDWLIRVQTTAWLELAGLTDDAEALRDCAEIVDVTTLDAAMVVLMPAKKRADAAGDAAWDAAGDAAWAAARDAAWAAAGAAAWAAAGDAAWAAAGDAAWAAAGDAAWAAAWAAARDALAPTVLALQESALDLVHRMIALKPGEYDCENDIDCENLLRKMLAEPVGSKQGDVARSLVPTLVRA